MAVGALEPQFYKEFIEGLELNIDDMQQNDWSEKNRKIVADKFKEKNQKEWCDVSNFFKINFVMNLYVLLIRTHLIIDSRFLI